MALIDNLKSSLSKFKTQSDKSPSQDIQPAEPNELELINPFTGEPESQQSVSSAKERGKFKIDPELAAASLKLKKSVDLSSINQMLEKSQPLLVFQAGSFGLRGALARDQKDQAVLIDIAQSKNIDFTRAIREILDQLKKRHKRLPKKAILITPSVNSALIHLPVSPLRPRSPSQMEELIRWEIEPSIAGQRRQWLLGAMLVSRGAITTTERDVILNELSIRQAQATSQEIIRFGDIAIEMGFLDVEPLEECSQLQDKLVTLDDDLAFSWQPCFAQLDGPSDESLLSMEDDRDRLFPWLVSAINNVVRQRWIGAFRLNRIKLEGLYPLLGNSYSLLNPKIQGDEEQLALEIQQEHIVMLRGAGDVIKDFKTFEIPNGILTADYCLDLITPLEPEIKQIYLNGNDQDELKLLSQEIAMLTGIAVHNIEVSHEIPDAPNWLNNTVLVALNSALQHHLKHISGRPLCRINPPIQKKSTTQAIFNRRNMAIAGGFTTVSGMIGALFWMHYNAGIQKQRLIDLDEKYESELQIKNQLMNVYNQSLQIRDEIAEIRNEISASNTLLEKVSADVSYRPSTFPAILKSLALGITPEVVLFNITKQMDSVSIKANSLSNAEGMEFVNNLGSLLKPVNYQVTNTDLTEEENTRNFILSVTLEYHPQLAQQLFESFKPVISQSQAVTIESQNIKTNQSELSNTSKNNDALNTRSKNITSVAEE